MEYAIEIDSRKIGDSFPPFIIAEMSANHNQSLDRALKIVKAAADTGVDAVKLQTFTPDSLTLDIDDGEFLISKDIPLWKGQSLYKLFKQAA
ncbi:MAG: N-acetylneuraminate synthase family protein, partial [bacterium]